MAISKRTNTIFKVISLLFYLFQPLMSYDPYLLLAKGS